MTAARLGAFVCHCGGNISDYLDVAQVAAAAGAEPDVVVAKTFLFACSDAAQEEMIATIKAERLDGIVVASCSPKLHEGTFRAMARRAGLNQFLYTQVNLREQCSWAHRRDRAGATGKGVRLVRAGLARARLGRPLEETRVETTPAALVIGAGVAGLRAAVALADAGLAVHLVERAAEPGGRVRGWGALFPRDRTGGELVATLVAEVRRREGITLYTGAEVVEKRGSVGNFTVTIAVRGERVTARVGVIVVATGFDPYAPRAGEHGSGRSGVVTLPAFKELLAASPAGGLRVEGRPVRTIAYVYCVGSRQPEGGHGYCSRVCCTAAVHTAILAQKLDPDLRQYHLYRDMRTYGHHELLYEEAGRRGSVFVRCPDGAPPEVVAGEGGLLVRATDELAGGEAIEIPADLVVLVTGMVARDEAALQGVLKLPVGPGGFFHEVHPKLRPVETISDGVLVAGAAQGPKTVAESVASALAAAAKTAALLLQGSVALPPLVARVDPAACAWCGECAAACPYDGAITRVERGGTAVAVVHPELCKGCGGCVPACAAGALEVEGTTDAQVTGMIEALAREVAR
jgi:heterodisulfide reductase subunit A